jgi:hypothetical protein
MRAKMSGAASFTPPNIPAISSVIARTAMRKLRMLVAGSEGRGGATTRRMSRRIGGMSAIGAPANGLACMRSPTFTMSGSPIRSRIRTSLWPTADGSSRAVPPPWR